MLTYVGLLAYSQVFTAGGSAGPFNYVLTGGNNGAWELVTHDLAVLAVGDPSLATGYITEVYYTGGSNISVDAITVYST